MGSSTDKTKRSWLIAKALFYLKVLIHDGLLSILRLWKWDLFMKEKSTLQWLYGYSKHALFNILCLSLMSEAIAGSFIVLALVSSRVLDIAAGQMEGSLGLEIFYLVAIILMQGLLNVLNSKLRVQTSTKIEMQIKQGVFSKLLKKKYEDVSKFHSGEILNRLTSDVDIVVNSLVSLIPHAVSMFTKIVAGLSVLFVIDAYFTGFVLLVGILIVFEIILKNYHKV